MRSRVAALVALAALIAFVAWLFARAPATTTPPTPDAAPAAVVAQPSPVVARPSPPAPDVTPPAPDVAPPAPPAVVVRGRWGTQPGEFGHTAPTEGNPEGPMAFAVAPDGSVAVLDTQNRRVQRFANGRFVSSFALATGAAQDLAVTPDGRLVSLDRLAAATVTLHGPDGTPAGSARLVGGPITEGGAVTAVFADAQGVYVEREHREVVRVLDASGREDPARPTLWGRPSRDGRQLLRAAIDDRMGGVVRVSVAARSNGAMDWSTAVPLGAPVLQLLMLDSDAAGRVYVAAETGTPTADGVRDAAVVAVRLDTTGAVTGTLSLPAPSGPEEVFRQMSVDDAGALYVMVMTPEGVEVRRDAFEP